MRLKVGLLIAVIFFLLITGFNFNGMPYSPDAFSSDAVTSHWGAAYFTRQSVMTGNYPLWRDTILAGAPFAANPLNKTAYPLQWLVLLLPPTIHLNVLIILHLLIAGVGIWVLVREIGLDDLPAAVSVLAYVMAPRMFAHLGAGHLDIVYALSWLPWFVWLLHIGHEKHGRLLYILLLSITSAMLFLSDVRVSLFGLLFGIAYSLWRTVQTRQISRLLLTVLAVIVFLPLVTALVIPLLSWQPYISRASLSVKDVGQFSLELLGLAGLILPAHEGQGVETLVYLGLPVLVLAILGFVSLPRSEKTFWGIVILFAVLWSLGKNTPFWLTLAKIDAVRWFRVPARAWLIVVLGTAILSGYGLQSLMHLADRWRENSPPKRVFWLRLIAAGLAAMLIVCGLSLLITGLVELKPSTGVMLIFNGLALGSVLLIILLRKGRSGLVALSLLAIVYADLTVTGVNWLEWRGQAEWLETDLPLAERLLGEDVARVYSPSYTLPQPVAEYAGLELFYGIDPFQLTAIVDVIAAASNVPVTSYSVMLPPPNLADDEGEDVLYRANEGVIPNVALLAEWNVSHVIAAYLIDDVNLQRVDTVNDVNIYRNMYFTNRAPDPIPEGYPSKDEILRLNRLTIQSVWISSVSFVMVAGIIALLSIRKAQDALY